MKVLVTKNLKGPDSRRFSACYEGDGRFSFGATPEAAAAALRRDIPEESPLDAFSERMHRDVLMGRTNGQTDLKL